MSTPRVLQSFPGSQATHTLFPGDVGLGFADDVLETLLGSCVALILTDPRRTIGAMCHVVHSGEPPVGTPPNTAYAVHAMNRMFGLLRSVGISPSLCDAYVYGGGNMFPDIVSARHVGQRNVGWIMDFLKLENIRIVHQSFGGAVYRKVRWKVGTGEPAVIESDIERVSLTSGQSS